MTQRDGLSKGGMVVAIQKELGFLRGKRVIYFGRQGDQHTEWFPGAAPAKPAAE